jgi:hypothetical protein
MEKESQNTIEEAEISPRLFADDEFIPEEEPNFFIENL